MILQDSLVIDCPREALYRVISDVENHAHLLPGYRESRIVERHDDKLIVLREAIIHGQLRRWTSEVHMEQGHALHFRQLEGPLRGMNVEWRLEDEGQKTRLQITHDVHVRPWWKKWWMEQIIARPAIERTARACLLAISAAADTRMPL